MLIGNGNIEALAQGAPVIESFGTDELQLEQVETLQVLCEIGADIVALLEADRRFGERSAVLTQHLLSEHSDYKPVPFGTKARSMGWHGNALLVRKDATVLDCEAIDG